MSFEADRDNKTEPSLTEMTEKALEILSKSPWGYLLIVEGDFFIFKKKYLL